MTPARKGELHREAPEPGTNSILAALPDDSRNRIFPQLTLQVLQIGDILNEPGDAIPALRFPAGAVVALSRVLQDGGGTVVAIIGREGMIGIRAMFGREQANLRAKVIVPGHAFALPAGHARDSMERHPGMREAMLDHMDRLINEAQQNVACAAHHTIENRVSRLLLEIRDRIDIDRIEITQELLADLLGVRREGVNNVASTLRMRNALRYARGKLEIVSRRSLENAACECYGVLRAEFPPPRERPRIGP